LVQNRNNVSEWSDMSTHGLLFQSRFSLVIYLRSVLLGYIIDHKVSE
jgi:hypothetical protein